VDRSDVEKRWGEFIDTQGADIADEIYTNLQETAHLFDTQDGTHAKWSADGLLGLLLVFDYDEAEHLLAAFYAGMDGVQDAQEVFGVWVTALMGIVRECLENHAI
jgi:hypothetical protein